MLIIEPADWDRYPCPIEDARDHRLKKDWDDLVKKVKLLIAAYETSSYETLDSRELLHDIGMELRVLNNVCRKWVGKGVQYEAIVWDGLPETGEEVG